MNDMSGKCYIILFLIITFLLSTEVMSDATNTISSSQIFRDEGNNTLISSGGSFELGFFSPQNSKNRYVGIWYKKITVRTVVWVANRESPLVDGSGALKVAEPGLLVLVNATSDVIWSTNTSRNVQTPVAQLLDSGNLIVKDANEDNPENFLWQSFSYPTDTFLPGMKLGWNFKTGLEVYLTSPKSSDDPAPGDYTFHLDPSGYPHISVKRKGSGVVYRTAPWNGVNFGWNPGYGQKPKDGQNPKYGQNNIYTTGVIMNENEVYYHFEQLNESVVTRLTLSEKGSSQRWIWVDRTQVWIRYLSIPSDNCDNYETCGPFGICDKHNSHVCVCLNKFKPKNRQGWDRGNWSDGCARSKPLDCQKGDVFFKYSGIKLPDVQRSWYNKSMTLEECKVLCSKNCSCTAYSSLDISSGEKGCLLWFGDLVDMKDLPTGEDIYIRMASSVLDSKRKKREILTVTLSLVVGILLLSLILFLYCQKRKKLDCWLPETGRRGIQSLNTMDNHPDESHKGDLELPQFNLSIIIKATDNFSIHNKLGEGGFGPVYKGRLEDGQEIAVKCLARTSHQGVNEFKNEVICIAELQHRNLVKLLGWCIQGEEMMLVYEHMANQSLDLILFDPTKSILLDWPRRFNIINGITRGLMYLHQDSRLRVIHRDLKASNILLDSDMNPKISDFGLARIFGGNEIGAKTSRVVGTYGYMSPEYATDGVFSVKSDVFSFGVLVLEIASGKRNRGFTHRDHRLNLIGHAWLLHKEGRSLELVDSSLRDSCYLFEVQRSIHIGLLCVQEHPEDRPSMSTVVLMLSNDGALPEAKCPGFFTARDILKSETSLTLDTTYSINTMSFTQPEGR